MTAASPRSTAAPTRSACSSPTSTRRPAPLVDLDRRMEIVRLGEGVDRTGRLSEAALERTFAACDGYAGAHRRAGRRAGAVRRDLRVARRREPRRVRRAASCERLGVEPEVVSGDGGGRAVVRRRRPAR